MSGPDQINSANLAFVEELYAEFLRDPAAVEPEWRDYFQGLADSAGKPAGNGASPRLGPSFRPTSIFNPPAPHRNGADAALAAPPAAPADDAAVRQERIDRLVRAYRVRGHLIARFDPLGQPRRQPSELKPEFYGLTADDMQRPVSTWHIQGDDVRTVGSIIERLRNTYCRWIGAQFMHIDNATSREWLQERMEGSENRIVLKRAEQLRILRRLTDAVIFEEFVQKKYLGAKSFSLEGAETLIPLLDLAIERAGEHGIQEIVLAMAHRGRLNVLANVMGKSPQEIFREFEDVDTHIHQGRIDVKYHLGYSSDWTTAAGQKIHMSLCFNPSHLEYVNPVAAGRTRAKQDRAGDTRHERGLCIMIHGDAAFAGEGVVQETLNLSDLEGYTTGGTVHIIVNNQIGFTTGPNQARSSTYCTDVAKMLQSPIFHVNGEEPEAVAQVVRLALDFRETFRRDVFIDMYCYRRRGHNEGDEPSFTQPLLYRTIERRMPVRKYYLEHLLLLGEVSAREAEKIAVERQEVLERELSVARSQEFIPRSASFQGVWSGYQGGPDAEVPDVPTGVDPARLARLLADQTRLPEGFRPHPKIERFLKTRREMAAGQVPLDWSAGESLALASLTTEGVRIRLTGQDSERGTFSHRHAVLHDVHTGDRHMPLAHLAADQGPIEIINSPLSEIAVLGFEYGYSLDWPDALVMWEAQFGDFNNVAQVIIDQFIASAEDKWRRASGVVMLLPHGFEGMGPEHSSARLERFLSLAARDNMQVVSPTTPAQIFHVLRRQVLRPWRKPLIVMTPKSLLRNPQAVSTFDDLAHDSFQRVIPDASVPPEQVKKILLCSGKIYYDLAARRAELKRDDVAIIRIEQLYPLPLDPLHAALAAYSAETPVLWVQEEPENMGAWRFLRIKLGERLLDRFAWKGLYRQAAAAPATGSSSSHKLEQEALLADAFE
jgi:2-oxoglutarate dehydrogenase E1 component